MSSKRAALPPRQPPAGARRHRRRAGPLHRPRRRRAARGRAAGRGCRTTRRTATSATAPRSSPRSPTVPTPTSRRPCSTGSPPSRRADPAERGFARLRETGRAYVEYAMPRARACSRSRSTTPETPRCTPTPRRPDQGPTPCSTRCWTSWSSAGAVTPERTAGCRRSVLGDGARASPSSTCAGRCARSPTRSGPPCSRVVLDVIERGLRCSPGAPRATRRSRTRRRTSTRWRPRRPRGAPPTPARSHPTARDHPAVGDHEHGLTRGAGRRVASTTPSTRSAVSRPVSPPVRPP